LVSWDLGLTLMNLPSSTLATYTKAEVTCILAFLCRVTRFSMNSHGNEGVERLLSHDVLNPILRLAFSATSTTIRLAATKGLCILLPFSSPR
jgi:hypothetical protein